MDQAARRRVYKLRFEELDDLRVRVRKPSLKGMRLLTRAVRTLGDDLRGEHLDSLSRLDAWTDLFDALADALIDWDLKDQGIPVPATQAGVEEQDIEFLMRIASAWYHRVVMRVDQPEPAATPEPAAPAASAPSAEELALASIPVVVGNGALEPESDEPDYVVGHGGAPAVPEVAEASA